MNRDKPKVGQILYSLNVGNAARHCKQKLTKVIVTKVGRKYFSCKDAGYADNRGRETQYHLSNWREKTEYCIDSALYVSRREWEDEKEAIAICHMIGQEAFRYGRNKFSLSLETLREIKRLIDEDKNNENG